MTSALIAAGAVLLILVFVWGAYAIGKRHGKTETKQDIAEDRAEEMARDATIASQPFKRRPLSSMLQPKD